MSVFSWQNEFLPINPESETARETPIAVSLRAWRGRRQEALTKHKVLAEGHSIYTQQNPVEEHLHVKCALCEVYREDALDAPCQKCPLAQAREGVPCDGDDKSISTTRDPWTAWLLCEDPEPMIAALEHTQLLFPED